MITGYVNLAYKHSIPKRFPTNNLSFIGSTWIYFDAKAMVSIENAQDGTSTVIVISDEHVQNITFVDEDPQLLCTIKDVKEGVYKF